MNEVIKKMQYKGEEEILILNSPDEFNNHFAEISNTAKVFTDFKKIKNDKKFYFILIFVKSFEEIKKYSALAKNNLEKDGNFWFAYPKKSSKKYQSEVTRDNGWQPLGDLGFEGVRAIAIDDDWSALRFRHVKNIKILKRDKSRIMSNDGNPKRM